MKNIEIVESNVDIENIKQNIISKPENWSYNTHRQRNIFVQKNTESIPLINGAIEGPFSQGKFNDSNLLTKTKLFAQYPEIIEFLTLKFPSKINRVSIVKLLPKSIVYPHIDLGKYYVDKDRYHLVIQGTYFYGVGMNIIRATPGTLFKFNNKKIHWSANLTDQERISVIFDVSR